MRGLAPGVDPGFRLALEYTTGRGPWRAIAHTRVHAGGAFRLRAPLTKSGDVRVVPVSAGLAPGVAAANVLTAPAVPPATLAPSAPQRVTVAAELAVPASSLVALPGRPLSLKGRLLPRRAGAVVRLQTRTHHHWRTVAVARTGRRGGFTLRHSFGGARRFIRVRFAGDGLNTAVSTRAQPVLGLHPALASWYYDAGNTACGFHAGYGVASPYLPCGTKVTFGYHGRAVTAVVDDRGPFVPGRSFDLNQNTAAALGFGGVDVVWTSI